MSGKTIATIIFISVIFLDCIVGLVKTYNVVANITKFKGRVKGKIVNIRNDYYYFRLFTKVNSYYLTFQYTIDEITYVNEFPFSYREKKYNVGQEIVLHFDLKNPEKYVPNEEKYWKGEIFRWILVITLFALLLLFGCYLKLKKAL